METTMKRQSPKQWSYTSGEKGCNRVRAFAHPETGRMFLEFREAGRRTRVALGHRDCEAAKTAAERAAIALRERSVAPRGALRLRMLFDNYMREVSPQKGPSAQQHDKRAVKLFCECWGEGREVAKLARHDWDYFISWRRDKGDRRSGQAKGRVLRNRVIIQDLKFMRAVLNWATQAGNGADGRLLDRNPLQGLPYPKEAGVRRPILLSETYEQLTRAAPTVGALCSLLLLVVHETGHRIGAVRLLRWSDLDLKIGDSRVHWRAENDKMKLDRNTPLSEEATESLRRIWRQREDLRDGWVFPSPDNPSQPISRHRARTWWKRIESIAALPPEPGRGWHTLRRKFATELKAIPLGDLAYLGGWRSAQTILKCYQQPDDQTLRSAIHNRGVLTSSGLRRAERTPSMDTTTQLVQEEKNPASA
jgi:integrase